MTTWSAQQEAIFAWFKSGTGNLVVRARAGTGKCLGTNTPVLMYDGSIKMVQDVVIGDLLMGPDGPKRVLSTTRGTGPLFKIIPTKGDEWVCNDVHVLTLVSDDGKVGDIPLNTYLRSNVRYKKRHRLFMTGVEFARAEPLPIDPYFLGVWYGDGTKALRELHRRNETLLRQVSVSKPDGEIAQLMYDMAAKWGGRITVQKQEDGCPTFSIVESPQLLEAMRREVGDLERLPMRYLTASRGERESFLAGLLDTDGYLTTGCYEIVQEREDWADDICFLARSLGIRATKRVKVVKGKTYWRMFLSGNMESLPLRIPRKQPKARRQIKDARRTGFRVEAIGDGDYHGFTLDGDGRFLLGDFTVTHNTTTILEGITHAPEQRILLAAFNKTIATELASRVENPFAEAKTLHGVGFACINRYWRGQRIDNDRCDRIARRICGEQAPDPMITLVARLTRLGKEMAVGATKIGDLTAIAIQHDCVPDYEWEEDGWGIEQVEKCALDAMAACAQRDGTIDFSDMIFLPLRNRWVRSVYDLIVVDEAQDMNGAQLELGLRSCAPGGRIVVVGDDRQAIYGFRGADSGAIDRLKTELKAHELGLNITYRCPRRVVALARDLVPDFTAAASAPEGTIKEISFDVIGKHVAVGDFVLSRKNAALVSVCLKILKVGIRARIQGKDIGKGMLALLKKLNGKSLPDMLSRLTRWEEREVGRASKLEEKKAEIMIGLAHDKADTLRALAEGMSGLKELEARIADLFSDDVTKAAVICSSIHKCKGLEAKNVFILRDTLISGNRLRCVCGHSGFSHESSRCHCGCTDFDPDPVKKLEEENLEYVAVTRSKDTLTWVIGGVA